MSIRSIAKEMGISRNSVRKYLKNEPVKKHKKKRGSKLDPYRDTVKALIEKKMTDRYGNKEYLKTEPISIAGIYNFIQNG